MSHQNNLRNIIQQLTELETTTISNVLPEEKDPLVEKLASEFRAFLSELDAATGVSSQAKPAAVAATGKTSTAAGTTGNTAPAITKTNPTGPAGTTAQATAVAQQDLEKTLTQLKPALGPNGSTMDPKKTAQALQAAAAGQQSPADAAKSFAPVLGKAFQNPETAKKLSDLLKNIK